MLKPNFLFSIQKYKQVLFMMRFDFFTFPYKEDRNLE